jgi:hypothetical protein
MFNRQAQSTSFWKLGLSATEGNIASILRAKIASFIKMEAR